MQSFRKRFFVLTFILAAAVFSGACEPSDDGNADPQDAGADGGDDAATASCTCLALGVDYENGVGVATAISLPSRTTTEDVLPLQVTTDAVLRVIGGKVYLINRFGAANLTIVDPSNWSVLGQPSLGSGVNAQDIAVVGDKAYIVTLDNSKVQVWDLSGAQPAMLDTINLASYAVAAETGAATPDMNPNAASIYAKGTKAYVVLEHLVGYHAAAKGTVVVIDTTTDEAVTSFTLQHENPFGFLEPLGDDLVIGTVKDPFVSPTMDGCLERITTGETPGSAACIVANAALGGYVNSVKALDDGSAYLAVSRGYEDGVVVHLAADGKLDQVTPVEHKVTDMAYCAATDQLVYNDFSPEEGGGVVRVLDLGTNTPSAPVDLGLPPAYQNTIVCW